MSSPQSNFLLVPPTIKAQSKAEAVRKYASHLFKLLYYDFQQEIYVIKYFDRKDEVNALGWRRGWEGDVWRSAPAQLQVSARLGYKDLCSAQVHAAALGLNKRIRSSNPLNPISWG